VNSIITLFVNIIDITQYHTSKQQKMASLNRKDQEQDQNNKQDINSNGIDDNEKKLTENKTKSSSATTTSADETIITPDPNNFEMKHPLQNKWTMWYDAPTNKKMNHSNWKSEKENSNKKIIDFDTVEDFWCLYNNLLKSSQLANKSNYQLMKEGILPAWESAVGGGQWELRLEQEENQIDRYWLWLVLAIIGESFEEDSNDILGAAIRIRNRGSRIELWTRRSSEADVCLRIGKRMKELLGLPTSPKVNYQSFEDLHNSKTGSIYEL